jgi:diacylglycerol O-acyltransferase
MLHSTTTIDNTATVQPAIENVAVKHDITTRPRALTHMGGFSLITESSSHPAIITAGFVLDKVVSIDYLKEVLQSNVLSKQQFYRYSSNVNIKTNKFIPTTVNLDQHVHTKHVSADQSLNDLVSQIISESLPMDRPLWELILIDNYGKKLNDGGCIILWRIHHVIGDGTSIAMSVLALCDDNAMEKMMDQITTQIHHHGHGHSGKRTILDKILTILMLFVGLLRIMFKWVWETIVIGLDPVTVIKDSSKTEHSTQKRVAYSSNEISVADAKRIGKPQQATVNDVMLCCLAGAIDRYTTDNKKQTTKRLDIRVTTPVNIRTSVKEFRCVPSNKFGFMVCRLPLGIPDSMERLQYIKQVMDYNKKLPEKLFSYLIAYFALQLVPQKLLTRFYHFMSNFQSLIATNVQAVSEPVYLNKAKVISVLPFTPVPHGVSLGVMILSYNNMLTISITTDKELIPDPQVLIQYFLEEFNHLLSDCTATK